MRESKPRWKTFLPSRLPPLGEPMEKGDWPEDKPIKHWTGSDNRRWKIQPVPQLLYPRLTREHVYQIERKPLEELVVDEFLKVWEVTKHMRDTSDNALSKNEKFMSTVLDVAGRIGVLDPSGAGDYVGTWEYAARQVKEWVELLDIFSDVETDDIEHFRSGDYLAQLRMGDGHRLLGMGFDKEIALLASYLRTVPELRNYLAMSLDNRYRTNESFVLEPVDWRFAFRGSPLLWAYFELSQLYRSETAKICPVCRRPFESNRRSYCSNRCQNTGEQQRKRKRKKATHIVPTTTPGTTPQ